MTKHSLLKQEERRPEVSAPERTRSEATFTPRCDIFETADELLLFADLPGAHPEHLDVRFENGQLEIYARCEAPRERGDYFLREYEVGDFYRAFTIREGIDAERITAELKQGVLTVHLPKCDAVKPRRIAVKG